MSPQEKEESKKPEDFSRPIFKEDLRELLAPMVVKLDFRRTMALIEWVYTMLDIGFDEDSIKRICEYSEFFNFIPRGSASYISSLTSAVKRALKAMETFGGVYSMFQSVSVFIIMIVVLLVVFTGNPDVAYYAYAVTPLTLMAMLVAFISLVPKEKFAYIDKSDPPKLYRLFKAVVSIPFACIMPAFIFSSYFGIPYGFAVIGLGALLSGLIAYRFERLIYKIDENYPTLIKSLGENRASASSEKRSILCSLSRTWALKKLLKRAYARLELGISNEKTMSLLSAEAASHRVYLVNKMFLDAFTYGANLLEASKVLGNSCVKLLEFRKKRASISKRLEAVVYILQPLTVALVVILGSLSKYFTQSLTSLPFFTFGQIPVEVVEFGNLPSNMHNNL